VIASHSAKVNLTVFLLLCCYRGQAEAENKEEHKLSSSVSTRLVLERQQRTPDVLFEGICNLPNPGKLTYLVVGGFTLEKGLSQIATDWLVHIIAIAPGLKGIDIDDISMSPNTIIAVFGALQERTLVEKLYFRDCFLESMDRTVESLAAVAQAVGGALQSLVALKCVNLSNNDFYDMVMVAVSQNVSSTVQHLYLQATELGDQAATALAQRHDLRNAAVIDVTGNSLGAAALAALAATFGDIIELDEVLDDDNDDSNNSIFYTGSDNGDAASEDDDLEQDDSHLEAPVVVEPDEEEDVEASALASNDGDDDENGEEHDGEAGLAQTPVLDWPTKNWKETGKMTVISEDGASVSFKNGKCFTANGKHLCKGCMKCQKRDPTVPGFVNCPHHNHWAPQIYICLPGSNAAPAPGNE
jgi:hypothetical protein